MKIKQVYGVDFSGAKLAGANIWIARIDQLRGKPRLSSLDNLGLLAGDETREIALAHLVSKISDSKHALWGIDFPFALPLEVIEKDWTFAHQLDWTRSHREDAYAFGRICVDRARALGGKLHIRRTTDVETKTPFDCYHYRIICQTFHGMRDVLAPLQKEAETVIPPFDLPQDDALRAVVEACPGSTLKRWQAPHNNYKQPAGGPLEPKRIRNRKLILAKLNDVLEIDAKFIRIMQRNPGGDALDAVIAAIGTWESWNATDWRTIAAHPRYRLEGRIFA